MAEETNASKYDRLVKEVAAEVALIKKGKGDREKLAELMKAKGAVSIAITDAKIATRRVARKAAEKAVAVAAAL